jgi:HEPN domain-containing protein
VGFHCQQAAEKYLKALLIRHQIEPPKSHDIERLLTAVRIVASDAVDALGEAAWLMPFGVEMRYPGDLPEPLPDDGDRALEPARLAGRVVWDELEPRLGGFQTPSRRR